MMKKNSGAKDQSDQDFKMMMSTATDGSISCMHINGGMKGQLLEGLVEIANGRFFKGLCMMFQK